MTTRMFVACALVFMLTLAALMVIDPEGEFHQALHMGKLTYVQAGSSSKSK